MRKKIEFKPSQNHPTETLLKNYGKRKFPKFADDKFGREIRSEHKSDAQNERFEMDPEFPDFPAKWEV